MKKRFLMVVMALAITGTLVGCGSKNLSKMTPEEIYKYVSSMSEEEFDKYYGGLSTDDQERVDSAILQVELFGDGSLEVDGAETEQKTVKAKLFKADKGWKNVQITDRAVQIDDVLYEPGFTVEDVMKKVESSSVKYEYDYSDKSLVGGKEFDKIEISRDGVNWFTIRVLNVSEDSASFKSCVVSSIVVEDAAKPYCRFIDGRSYEDIMKMSIDDVKELQNSIFKDATYEENSKKHKKEECLEEHFNIGTVVPNSIKSIGYEINHGLSYDFYISKETGEMIDFEANTAFGATWEQKGADITSVSELDEYESEIIASINENLDLWGDYTVANLEGRALHKFSEDASWSDGVNYIVLFTYNAGGSTQYGYNEFDEVTVGMNGLSYDDSSVELGYDSFEDAWASFTSSSVDDNMGTILEQTWEEH